MLTVVIPTRNRRSILELTLGALEKQEIPPKSFEVIVIDDGSDDDTSQWLKGREFESFDLKILTTGGIGPAGARNLGISHATGDRVLLLGDDTIPLPSTLGEHVSLAGGRDVGVQGRIEWDPTLEITPVMRFLAPEGPQFWFKGLTDGEDVPFTGVYGSNLSAPTRWFREEPFDETFENACFEDTEQAWRWSRRGWGVVFGDRAICRHRHHYESLEPILRRQRTAGAATRYTVRKHRVLLWALVFRPASIGLLKAAGVGARALVRRTTFEDKADLQCRWAWFRGMLGLS